MMMMRGERTSRHPFTAVQWQELEHQLFIFKYMSSGIPIPSELILSIRRSLVPTLGFLNPQPNIEWMLFGMKEEDPQPWRCRRTDGKKWRCSQKVNIDSKYCERHKNRGKNRSRKPVEMTSIINPTTQSSISSNFSSQPPHTSSYCNSPGLGFNAYGSDTHFPTDTVSHSSENNYRLGCGTEVVDENHESSAASGEERESNLEFRPHEMRSLGELNQSYTTQQRNELPKEKQHCFVFGTDLMLGKPLRVEREDRKRCFLKEEPLKTKKILDHTRSNMPFL